MIVNLRLAAIALISTTTMISVDQKILLLPPCRGCDTHRRRRRAAPAFLLAHLLHLLGALARVARVDDVGDRRELLPRARLLALELDRLGLRRGDGPSFFHRLLTVNMTLHPLDRHAKTTHVTGLGGELLGAHALRVLRDRHRLRREVADPAHELLLVLVQRLRNIEAPTKKTTYHRREQASERARDDATATTVSSLLFPSVVGANEGMVTGEDGSTSSPLLSQRAATTTRPRDLESCERERETPALARRARRRRKPTGPCG